MWQTISTWLSDNRTWVFSGVGVGAISAVGAMIRWLVTRDRAAQQIRSGGSSQNLQSTGGSGQNIQAGRDVNVGIPAEWSDPRVEHDRELFRRYEAAMTEQQLRDEIDDPLYAHRTNGRFLARLDGYLALGGRTEGEFLTPDVQATSRALLLKLAELRNFITRHFFVEASYPDGATIYGLYPEMRHEHGTRDADYYDEQAERLNRLGDEIEELFVTFRRAVKDRLMI